MHYQRRIILSYSFPCLGSGLSIYKGLKYERTINVIGDKEVAKSLAIYQKVMNIATSSIYSAARNSSIERYMYVGIGIESH